MRLKKKKAPATAVVSDELPASALVSDELPASALVTSALVSSEPPSTVLDTDVEQTPLPKKDFRKAHLNAGVYDEDGTLWTENSYTLADGSGDTFGPGHPKVPAKVKEVRTRNHKPESGVAPG